MYQFRTLQNGIRVVAERIDYLKSVSIGIWVGNGSRCENASENGISHFIEHMLFKGTENRSAAEIASAIDSIGGQIDAFTGREYTCFYTKTLSDHTHIALDVLSEMIFRPTLDAHDMTLERMVIGEEIRMYEDSPEDLVYDLSSEAAWGSTPMGRPILGTYDTLAAITPEIMRAYMQSHYTSSNLIISVAGGFGDDFFDMLEHYFGSQQMTALPPPTPEAKYLSGRTLIRTKDIEQVQLVAAFKGIDVMDEAVYSLLVMNNVFGFGMSSRLFQRIREERGLVYSISAGHSAYLGAGSFDISAGMRPESVKEVAELISQEIRTIKRDKLTRDEVERSKEQLKGSYILASESTGARMQGAGRALLIGKPVYTQDEVLKKIDAVNTDTAAEIIDRVLDGKTLCLAAVGPVDTLDGMFHIS